MPRRRYPSIYGCLLLPMLVSLLLAADTSDTAGYTPVAPPAALDLALRAQLKVVQDWLKDKDYASAGEAARGLTTLAQHYGHQSGAPSWRKLTTDLVSATSKLADAAKRKAAAEASQAIQECQRLLLDMAKNPPAGPRAVVKDFKPGGTIKTWMLLMDGAYVDAKSAKNARDVELLALAIAEETNAIRYLRAEKPWRQTAREVQDAALKVAGLAKDKQLEAAKKALKDVYRRCEVCHGRYQK